MGGEQASNAAVQLDRHDTAGPCGVRNLGTPENTLDTLGANGILGVGTVQGGLRTRVRRHRSSNPGIYYTCPAIGMPDDRAVAGASAAESGLAVRRGTTTASLIQLPSVPLGRRGDHQLE